MAKTRAPKKSQAAPKPRPAAIKIEVDRALKKRWDALHDALKGALREGASAFDRLWETAAEIVEHDPPLYLAGGFATDKAFFADVLNETERSARRNMRVAKYASPDEEVRYGTSKLDAVLGFLDAKNGGPPRTRTPVDFEKLRIPVTRAGKTVAAKVEDATVEEIAAATRAARRKTGTAPRKTSPVAAAVARELRSGALRGISVHVAAGKLALGDIPLAALPALAKALARIKLPDDEA